VLTGKPCAGRAVLHRGGYVRANAPGGMRLVTRCRGDGEIMIKYRANVIDIMIILRQVYVVAQCFRCAR